MRSARWQCSSGREVTALQLVEVASADSAYESLVAQAREQMDKLITQELRGAGFC